MKNQEFCLCGSATSSRHLLEISLKWEVEPPRRHSQSLTGNDVSSSPLEERGGARGGVL